MAVLAKAKVGRDFRVTVPQEVREHLQLNEGEELVFFTIEDQRGRVCFRVSRG